MVKRTLKALLAAVVTTLGVVAPASATVTGRIVKVSYLLPVPPNWISSGRGCDVSSDECDVAMDSPVPGTTIVETLEGYRMLGGLGGAIYAYHADIIAEYDFGYDHAKYSTTCGAQSTGFYAPPPEKGSGADYTLIFRKGRIVGDVDYMPPPNQRPKLFAESLFHRACERIPSGGQ